MSQGQKRTRADKVSAQQEAEQTRCRRDIKHYEAWCKKQEAGVPTAVDPIPTCCPCFDNCGEHTSSLSNYGPKHNINTHTLAEVYACLFPHGMDSETLKQIVEDPDWHLAPQEVSSPQTSHRLSEPLAALPEVIVAIEKFNIGDSAPHQHQRKAKQPKSLQHKAAQHSSSLDLNTTKEDCITRCQKNLTSYPFYHAEERSIHFTPYIIGQKKKVDGEPGETYLVHYWPEDFLPDQWLPEEEATKTVVKKCVDLEPWAFHKLQSLPGYLSK